MKLAFAFALLACVTFAQAEIKKQTVEYKDGDTTLKGYVAYDDAQKTVKPGVLVVQEWWGLTDYVKSRCDQLAAMGYVAFAPDIYGDGVTTNDPKVAQAKMEEAVKNGWRRSRTKLGLDQLLKDEGVDKSNITAIGYCFGGGCVLELARSGADVKGVVSFHGSLGTDKPAQKGEVKAKVLICSGGADPMVPAEAVAKAEEEFKDAGVDVRVITYENAQHAFTNPEADSHKIPGIKYDKAADEKSWADMKAFFAEILTPKQ